jgi:hypothetical protein
MMVCCLFFNFAALFDFGCCSLAQEMTFLDCYQLNFRQWLITCTLSALLPFQSLLKVCMEINFFPLSPSLVCLQYPTPLLHVLFQFLVYYSVFVFVFCGIGVRLSRGYAGLSQGGCGNTA